MLNPSMRIPAQFYAVISTRNETRTANGPQSSGAWMT